MHDGLPRFSEVKGLVFFQHTLTIFGQFTNKIERETSRLKLFRKDKTSKKIIHKQGVGLSEFH